MTESAGFDQPAPAGGQLGGQTSPRPPIAVVGAGLMGSQIGAECALAGHPVHLLARDAQRSRVRIQQALSLAGEAELFDAEQIALARSNISFSTEVSGLADDCAVIFESLPEDMELKVELLRRAMLRMPSAIVASNTSSLSIGELGERIGRPADVVGAHYWNPPLLMPLVEVTRGAASRQGAVDYVCALLGSIGKVAVRVDREVPGFIWNRLQMALLREAIWLVESGVATVGTVDLVARLGLARRWNTCGPFAAVAAGGPETWQAVAENLFPELSTATGVPVLRTLLDPEMLDDSDITAVRDADLAARLLQDRAADRTVAGAQALAGKAPDRSRSASVDT